jgi:hypothetical protein
MNNRWNIRQEDIQDKELVDKLNSKWMRAKATMKKRTRFHELFAKVSHNVSIFNDPMFIKEEETRWSEGSTQAIKRKIRAQTIQRVPDGEITTQYDKSSVEQIEIEFLFKNKIIASEYDNKDMLKNLWKAFNQSYDYGFACVRTGFELDTDSDVRVTFKLIQYNDIYPAPDCDFIEEAPWYFVREFVSHSDLEELIDKETGEVADSTYNADAVKYIVENHAKSGVRWKSTPLADRDKGAYKFESIEVRTLYQRGAKEFVSYVPSVGCVLRTVKNADPRRDVPLHFLILEPDPEFPLGCSSVMWTMAQQQFADTFLTIAGQTLPLALQPPLMGFGNLTPAKMRMKPRAFWPMGTNPNNKVEAFRVETTTLTQYGSILENTSANMMKNLNIADGTIASDAHTMNYSKTAPGVHMQQQDKTITINQFQKRMEIFFAEWCNHALRSYLSSMSGVQEVTVDERTRRRIWDVEAAMESEDSIIKGDKISIDFNKLSSDLLSFEVRTGSMIENQREAEVRSLQEMLLPVTQMMSGISEDNKAVFEELIMKMVGRIMELSDIDIAAQGGKAIDNKLMEDALQATMEQVMMQQMQIQQLAAGQQAQQPPIEGAQPPMTPASQPPAPEVSAEFPEGQAAMGNEMTQLPQP